ncbi:branched-chain amino acid aminotransferase [Actinocatenispora rupis]|uniref:Branched-chain-amino-acid aminotransferase n=1 Tax=Actinocatenispora rupis TaxID=519421 RepID=A0A8J3J9N7_9ACTN|nr:branched-chain amino acid aminotransferase [Actinocatenispora rupis]GID14410.1 branched-chain-amino-acid aminotransferase [Actinocatenispora rupis]
MSAGATGKTNTAGLEFEVRPNPRPTPPDERAALLVNPGFGRIFTDHMVTIRYSDTKGWYDARLEPYGPISLSPATAALHYAQEIFEGLKAYHSPDGGITLFRPEANARRMQLTCDRMAMPRLPEEEFLTAVRLLVERDREWIPTQEGGSLYIRPFMFATEVFLGVKPSSEYLFCVIASPAGSYFAGGVQPVDVWVSAEYTRAAPGGTGAAKCAGNYASSLVAQAEAIEAGCDQVVFLDAVERRYVDELGGMNVFSVYGDGDDVTLVTPPLAGTILPGITRESVLALAGQFGWRVEERQYAVDEWQADAESGLLRESFACGTAAVVTPIGRVRGADLDFTIGGGAEGPVTRRLRETLLDIQHGRVEDTHGWVHRLA